MAEPFEKKTYFAMALDPVHVGTGGYRLGRVDNTISREPGTNLPKIPGSSIAGVTRAYAAMAIQSENYDPPIRTGEGWIVGYDGYKKWKYQRPAYDFLQQGTGIRYSSDGKAIIKSNVDGPMIKKDRNDKDIYLSCAGKGADDGEGHCGRTDCEICVPFGFSKKGNSFQGLAQFFDARILFFPVHSMIGPVWIVCKSSLNDFCETLKSQSITVETENKLNNDESIQTDLVDVGKNLNLGWLLLKNAHKSNPIKGSIPDFPPEIVSRSVLVPDKLFSRIVNDNLEVRTSVAIDPATGAAEDGALYTYEAIPRVTVMWFDVVYNNPEYFRINGQEIRKNAETKADVNWIQANVEKGLGYFETLGIGGMNTRGMGRVKILNLLSTVAVTPEVSGKAVQDG